MSRAGDQAADLDPNTSHYCYAHLPYRDPATAGIGTPADLLGRPKLTRCALTNGRLAPPLELLDTAGFLFVQGAAAHTRGVAPPSASSASSASSAPWQWSWDWDDSAAVAQHYFPEIEGLVRRSVRGADDPAARILIFDHALRTGGGILKTRRAAGGAAWQGYGGLVHTDATVRSVHERAKDQVLGTTETRVKYGGEYPAGWGEVRPTEAWRERLFRRETEVRDDTTRNEELCVLVAAYFCVVKRTEHIGSPHSTDPAVLRITPRWEYHVLLKRGGRKRSHV